MIILEVRGSSQESLERFFQWKDLSSIYVLTYVQPIFRGSISNSAIIAWQQRPTKYESWEEHAVRKRDYDDGVCHYLFLKSNNPSSLFDGWRMLTGDALCTFVGSLY